MNATVLSAEVDQNFDFFQRTLAVHLAKHSGQYALIRHRAVVGYFDDPGVAAHKGKESFPDGIFSIQEVTDEPIDLGLYSNAAN